MLNRREFLAAGAAFQVAPESGIQRWELFNAHFRIGVRAGADGVWMDVFAFGRGPAHNLVPASPQSALERSSTALLVEGGRWWGAEAGASFLAERSAGVERLQLSGIRLGPEEEPLARETWRIELDGGVWRWEIERVYQRRCRVLADRFPALVLTTTVPRKRPTVFSEIPGVLDPEARLDGTEAFPLDGKLREIISPRRRHEIRLAPSGIVLAHEFTVGWFSVAKRAADGTAPSVAIAAGTVDRSAGPAKRERGSRQRQRWRLGLRDGGGAARFELELPDPVLTERARAFAAVHNQWCGWMFGNNPASIPALQEMSWFPMIQGIHANTPEAIQAMETMLRFFAQTAVDPRGYVFPRWWMEGYYRVVWGNVHDQIPHFILAMYHHAVQTGSRDFLRAVMPAVERVARYMLTLDGDGDGVVEIPETTGLADGGRDCSNWYDIIKFGHKDAHVNAYCVLALEALAEIAEWLGTDAAKWRSAHENAIAAHNAVFWDEAEGFYRDWIDVRGEARRYLYTDHNLLAIIGGIAGPERAGRILANLDRRYAEIRRQFGLPPEAIHATPCNMIPVSRLGDMVDFGELQNQKQFPNYENGCSFFHTTGLEIAARATGGQADQAYDTFERVMRHGWARHRFWGAALKWDTGPLLAEPLNNSLLILWGFLRGCFGVWPALGGLRRVGQPPGRMEGARYRFCHLGADVELMVRDRQIFVEQPGRGHRGRSNSR
jgi:hypothetical protein